MYHPMNNLAYMKPRISATHVADYHLFSVQGSIEFVSLCIRIGEWIRDYQSKVFKAIMGETSIPGVFLNENTKRDHLDSDDEDQPDKKRRHLKQPPSESRHGTSEIKSGQQYGGRDQNTDGQKAHDQPIQDDGFQVRIRIQKYSKLTLSRILLMILVVSSMTRMMRETSRTTIEILALVWLIFFIIFMYHKSSEHWA